jgi:class 3 adenylate cyclase/tetratricopeptide (TPR) repeat protein
MVDSRRERKVVTVLFCDLVGFTSRAESLDPEDVEALLAPYHARVRSELERHGGTVEKFIGDAVMALFGAPVAHEDDPERAVRAALAIRDFAVAEGLELRVGITTGEVLIRLDARPTEGEGMASGDVVNTAARLQNAAPVNGVLVDESTFRPTRGVVEYRDGEPVQAKGKTQPVPVWEAVEAHARFGADVAHEARTALVGRDRELAVLRDAFDRARHERVPQLVTLVGVPGLGKSRLVYELSRLTDADPELVVWRQGRCLAYGDGITLWALAEILKAQAGIVEQDTAAEAGRKLRAAVDDALGGSGDEAWVESHLRPLVGLEAESELGGDRRGEAFAAWRRFIEGLADQRTVVFIFEDLHWADVSLLDFVDELCDWVTDAPLLVLATARPDLFERRPGWGGGKLNATTLALTPLSDEQTALLIAQLLDRPVLAVEEQRVLLGHAGGNPLYAEQFADLYLERGSAEELPLPETLQGIIAARLDDLLPEEKALLHSASVVGKVFWTGALGFDGRAVAPALHSLERKGFVRRQRRSSVAGETELAFAHALVRDVAYGQIPRAERVRRHCEVAGWIESLGRPEDHAEMVAYHWRSALELADAAGQDAVEIALSARMALRRAGDRAFAVNGYAAAAAYYEDALGLWPEDDHERPQLQFRYARALHIAADDRSADALEEARDALLAAGDRQAAADAEVLLSNIWWHRGRRDDAFAHLARAEELAGRTQSPATARVLATAARRRAIGGEPEVGLRIAGEALAMAEALGLDELRAHALTTIGSAKGETDDGWGVNELERALELALEASPSQAGAILNNLAVADFFALDLRGAMAHFDEGLEIAERVGDGVNARWLRAQLARMAFMLGRWDEASHAADEFIAECEAGSPHYMEVATRQIRGVMRVARSDPDGGLADIRRGLALAREAKDPQVLLPMLDLCVLAFEPIGHTEEARELIREALAIVRAYPYAAIWGTALAICFSRLGADFEQEMREVLEPAPAGPWKDLVVVCLDRDFERAAEIWAEAGSRTWEALLRLRAAEELIEAGQRAEGEAELRRALAFYRSVGATFYIDRAEALMAKSA